LGVAASSPPASRREQRICTHTHTHRERERERERERHTQTHTHTPPRNSKRRNPHTCKPHIRYLFCVGPPLLGPVPRPVPRRLPPGHPPRMSDVKASRPRRARGGGAGVLWLERGSSGARVMREWALLCRHTARRKRCVIVHSQTPASPRNHTSSCTQRLASVWHCVAAAWQLHACRLSN